MTKKPNPRDPRTWTNRDIEADSAGYVRAQEAFAEDQEAAEQQRREADDLARFTAEYIRNGGRERDAAAEWRTRRNRQASEAAARSNTGALEASRRHILQNL